MTHLARAIEQERQVVEAMLSAEMAPAAEHLASARRLWLVGTGTSQHAAELGVWMFGAGERDVHWISSASFMWRPTALGPDDGVIVISHTAETAFAQHARQRAEAAGARLISITGIGSGWSEAIETIPRERSETYTGSYLAALVVLARIALALEQAAFARHELLALPDFIQSAAQRQHGLDLAPERLIIVTGIGPGAITAREGALKLREAARLPAEGYEAEYLLHGSAVPLGPSDALLALQPSHDRSGLLQRLCAVAESAGLEAIVIEEPGGLHPVLTQLPLTVRLQVLASHMAGRRNFDPDLVITGPWDDDGLWQAGRP